MFDLDIEQTFGFNVIKSEQTFDPDSVTPLTYGDHHADNQLPHHHHS